MEEIVYLGIIIFLSIIIFYNLKHYVGIEGMTLTEEKKRELEKSKIINAKDWHYSVKADMPKQKKKLNQLEKIYSNFKKKYDKFLNEEKIRDKIYPRIRKIAYPEEEKEENDKEEDNRPLCERTPKPAGCGKVKMKGEYGKVQDEILQDNADPEEGEIPNSLEKWTSE